MVSEQQTSHIISIETRLCCWEISVYYYNITEVLSFVIMSLFLCLSQCGIVFRVTQSTWPLSTSQKKCHCIPFVSLLNANRFAKSYHCTTQFHKFTAESLLKILIASKMCLCTNLWNIWQLFDLQRLFVPPCILFLFGFLGDIFLLVESLWSIAHFRHPFALYDYLSAIIVRRL